jgi:hypothetical protein
MGSPRPTSAPGLQWLTPALVQAAGRVRRGGTLSTHRGTLSTHRGNLSTQLQAQRGAGGGGYSLSSRSERTDSR